MIARGKRVAKPSASPLVTRIKMRTSPEESVGKIRIRQKQGMKNHSSSSKNSLQGKYAQEIFDDQPEGIFPTDSERVPHNGNPFQGFDFYFYCYPRVVAAPTLG